MLSEFLSSLSVFTLLSIDTSNGRGLYLGAFEWEGGALTIGPQQLLFDSIHVSIPILIGWLKRVVTNTWSLFEGCACIAAFAINFRWFGTSVSADSTSSWTLLQEILREIVAFSSRCAEMADEFWTNEELYDKCEDTIYPMDRYLQ